MRIIEPRPDDLRVSGPEYVATVARIARWWVGEPRQNHLEFRPCNTIVQAER